MAKKLSMLGKIDLTQIRITKGKRPNKNLPSNLFSKKAKFLFSGNKKADLGTLTGRLKLRPGVAGWLWRFFVWHVIIELKFLNVNISSQTLFASKLLL